MCPLILAVLAFGAVVYYVYRSRQSDVITHRPRPNEPRHPEDGGDEDQRPRPEA